MVKSRVLKTNLERNSKNFGKAEENEKQERRALQTLQPSVEDEHVLVGSTPKVNLIRTLETKIGSSVSSVCSGGGEKLLDMGKESREKIMTRSQTRHQVLDSQPSANDAKKVKKGSKSSKKSSASSCSTSSSKGSSRLRKNRDKKEENTRPSVSADASENLSASLSEEYASLIADVPITSWKELAEQRRAALEETLYQNELLHDQLIVLQAENAQLRSVVESARELASFLIANLGDDDVELTKQDLISMLGFEDCASLLQ